MIKRGTHVVPTLPKRGLIIINIWEYANAHPRIRLVDKKGKQYIGQMLMVFDALEADDEWDSIRIELHR